MKNIIFGEIFGFIVLALFASSYAGDARSLAHYLKWVETIRKGDEPTKIPGIQTTKFPELWESIDANIHPGDSINAWDYRDRMKLYKNLVLNINHCEWATTNEDTNHFGNILWGLPLQHGWQFSTGRLSIGSNSTNSTEFTSSAWWGDMNYYLSVIPYFGAVSAGLAPSVSILPIADDAEGDFCLQPSDCVELTAPWKSFFQYLNSTKSSCGAELMAPTESKHLRTPLYGDYFLSPGMEALLGLLWKAHLHSINAALPRFTHQLALMSPAEQTFSVAWAGLVDLIAGSLFPCNNTQTVWLQNLLPPRLLLDGDVASLPIAPGEGISGLSALQNRAVWLIDEIYSANATLDGEVERLWDRGMCVSAGRAIGREMLTMGIYRISVLASGGVKLAEQMVKDVAMHAACDE